MKKNLKKKIIFALCTIFFVNFPFAEENSQEGADTEASTDSVSFVHAPGVSPVPEAKRPAKADEQKILELDLVSEDERENTAEVLKFGLESDMTELLDRLIKNEDVRFTEEVYDLFQETKSSTVREKILAYFSKIKDPCLEDFAVTVINDPYDERQSLVSAVFSYIQNVKTEEAIPALLTLIEGENDEYFTGALSALGAVGGAEEAVFLSEYLEREDLSVAQRQQLVRVLGQINAVETFDSLSEMALDEDENTFVRMYSAEAIGAMKKKEAIPILAELYESSDPKIREYVIRGLKNFTDEEEADKIILQATRDSHYRVRLEAIDAIEKNKTPGAVQYLIYRAKNDPENAVKNASIPAIAKLDTKEGNEYLVGQIKDKNVSDNTKSIAAKALLETNSAGTEEILALARETLKDNRRKPLRYALGKEFAKYERSEFEEICLEYLKSDDVATQGTGLDIYARGRYEKVLPEVEKIVLNGANGTKKNANAEKAEKILGKDNEAVKKAEKIKKDREEKKNAPPEKKPSPQSSKPQKETPSTSDAK